MTEQGIPESRVYRHRGCGNETVISGEAFCVASNPLADMTRTWCTPCNAFFAVSEYEWADTGEAISDYYLRHSAKASSLDRFLCSKKFLIASVVAGLVTGIVIGVLVTRNGGPGQKVIVSGILGLGGAFVAAAVNVSVISRAIVKRVCGVEDTRTLT